MLTAVLILAWCGVAGGYLTGKSALFEMYRDRHERRRDVLDAALHGLLDDLGIPYGTMDGDTKTLPVIPVSIPDGKQRRSMQAKWAWSYLVTCNICAGWHAAYVALAVWAAGAALTALSAPIAWGEAFPVWLAACGVHTAVTAGFNKLEVW